MYSLSLFFCFLLLPLFAARFFVLQKKIPVLAPAHRFWGKGLLFLVGISQDLIIVLQPWLLFLGLKYLFALPFTAAFCLFLILILCMQINVILDAFLFQQTSIRLEASFLSFLMDIRCFWDSAKERKFWLIIPLAGLLLAIDIECFAFFSPILKSWTLSREALAIFILLCLPGFLGEVFLSQKLIYGSSNVVMQQQVWLVKKILSYLKRRRKLSFLNGEAIKQIFPMHGEKATFVSDTHPFLKYTHGFTGDKVFDISLSEHEKPHLIFLFMESFRAKDVGCISGAKGATPYFDELAKEGILFTNFYSNSIKTSRAVTASLFGIPSDVDSSNAANRTDLPLLGIADLLKQHSYHTAYIHNGMLQFENQFEFFKNHGYETILGKEDILKNFPQAPSTSWGVHDEYLMQYAADWLASNRHNPSFLTMFTITNHHPWTSPPGYGLSLPRLTQKTAYNRYLQTFRYSDHALNLFIKMLKQKGLSKNSIIFILGDHGQPMGEHNQNYSPQKGLYEENVHVPLLILAEGRVQTPKVIDTPCSQLDLLPTVMDVMNLKGFNHAVGDSLARKSPLRQIFFHNPYVYGFFGCREGDFKFIYSMTTGEMELFDLAKDPGETQDIHHLHPQLVKELFSQVVHYQNLFKSVYQNRRIVDPRECLYSHFHQPALR